MDERLLKKVKQLTSLVVTVKCEACGIEQSLPFVENLADNSSLKDVGVDAVAELLSDNFSLVSVNNIDLFLCLGCKNSTSLTDLRAIAGRVRREAEKKNK